MIVFIVAYRTMRLAITLAVLACLGTVGCELVFSTRELPGDAATDKLCLGNAGPVPIHIPDTGYCIDSTEVTRSQYKAFLDAKGTIANETDACTFKNGGTYLPIGKSNCPVWPPSEDEALFPVSCVDWCDARAYCRWAGKRLCGAVGGGTLPPSNGKSSTDEWYLACSRRGIRTYPYGNQYGAATCNGIDFSDGGMPRAVPVGTLSGCIGGYDDIYDMSGNVAEWIDQCETTSDICHPRGGSYAPSQASLLRCESLGGIGRDAIYADVGFRCCSDTR